MILSSFSLKPGLVWLLLTSASNRVLASLPSNKTTFPCPGHSLSSSWSSPGSPFLPDSFSSIPLADRPRLERIVLNGFSLNGLEATTPVRSTTDPANSWHTASPDTVAFEKGFVQRPFRRIIPDGICGSSYNEPLLCHPGKEINIEGKNVVYSALVREQLLVWASIGKYGGGGPLEIRRIRNDADNASGNWGSFQAWEDAIADFVGCSDSEGASHSNSNENGSSSFPVKYGFRVIDYRDGSCQVNHGCIEFDAEFLDDLAALRDAVVIGSVPSFIPPWRGPAIKYDHEAFVTFTNKWGHGAVDFFQFGQHFIQLYNDDKGSNGSRPVLYLGRAGGTELDVLGSSAAYTDDECLDPQPSSLIYTRWDDYKGWRGNFWDIAPRLSEELADILHIGFQAFYHDLRQGNDLYDQARNDFAEAKANCAATLPDTVSTTLPPTPAISDSAMPTQEPAENLRSASNDNTTSGASVNAVPGSVFVVQVSVLVGIVAGSLVLT